MLLFLLLCSAPAAAQQPLGVFGLWGAFRTAERCYAIAEPDQEPRPGDGRAYASVGFWPQRGVRGQAYFRLRQPKRPGSAVLLRIDGASFQLVGSGRDAWAPDGRADDAILTAMRTGLNLVVETRAANGARFRDGYQLRGAATAIDAAALACRPRR